MSYCWRKMSERNIEERINIKFCAKIDKSADEAGPIKNGWCWPCNEEVKCLWVILAVQERIRCARWYKKWTAKNKKNICKCGQNANLGAQRFKFKCATASRTIVYELGKQWDRLFKFWRHQFLIHSTHILTLTLGSIKNALDLFVLIIYDNNKLKILSRNLQNRM